MSTHNIGFYEEISKLINQRSTNMQLISSSVYMPGVLSMGYWQTVLTQIRCHIMGRLIRVFTVCFNMSLVVRKPVFGVFDQVRYKLGCTTTQDG